jgi:hypothetical protein
LICSIWGIVNVIKRAVVKPTIPHHSIATLNKRILLGGTSSDDHELISFAHSTDGQLTTEVCGAIITMYSLWLATPFNDMI